MRYSFPAIFEQDSVDMEAINVVFPDIIGAVTFGIGYTEAMEMAKDLLLGLLEQEKIRNIKPTPIEKVSTEFGKVMLVEVEYHV